MLISKLQAPGTIQKVHLHSAQALEYLSTYSGYPPQCSLFWNGPQLFIPQLALIAAIKPALGLLQAHPTPLQWHPFWQF